MRLGYQPSVRRLTENGGGFSINPEEETEEGRSDTLLTEANFRRYEKMVTASLFKELFCPPS